MFNLSNSQRAANESNMVHFYNQFFIIKLTAFTSIWFKCLFNIWQGGGKQFKLYSLNS